MSPDAQAIVGAIHFLAVVIIAGFFLVLFFMILLSKDDR